MSQNRAQATLQVIKPARIIDFPRFFRGPTVPIYAYKCSACGFAKDTLQKMSDPLLTVCPECNQETFSKQVTAAGFQLKGSGWYVTDFRNNGSAAASGGTDKSGDGKSSDGKTPAAADVKSAGAGENGKGAAAPAPAAGAKADVSSASSSSTAAAPAAPSKPASGSAP